MLYTESFEISSPESYTASLPASSPKGLAHSYIDVLKNRLTHPYLDLGLCLGSSTIAIASKKKTLFFPARLAIRSKDRKVVAFGLEAEELEGREPEGVSVVQPIQNGVVLDQKLASYLLQKSLSSARHGVISSLRVAVAVHPNLTPVESQTLLAALKAAGIAEAYFVEETLAAAAESCDLCEPRGQLVIQIGAGATHVSALCLASSFVSGSVRLGGDALDQAIIDHVRQKHDLTIDKRTAQLIKKELGSALLPAVDSQITISGQHVTLGKPNKCEVGALEVYQVLSPLLQQIALEVRRVVGKMPLTLLDDVRQQGAVLSGGTAKLRGLDEFLARETRLELRVPEQPSQAVALGLQRFLKNSSLRQAIFNSKKAAMPALDPVQGKGSGILGALILSAALAFSLQSVPLISSSLAGSVDSALAASLIPSTPLMTSWQVPAAGDAVAIDSFAKGQESELQKENDRLRKLLKSPLAKAIYSPMAAEVVARDPRGWMSTLTINAGSQSGLLVGMPVTDGINLVGQLVQVQPDRSQVRLFTDPKTVVSARIPTKRGSGVVVGTGADSLEMRYLDPDSGVKTGDWAVTSGLDHMFPAGLKIGWVTRIAQSSGQNTMTALIKPAMNVHQLDTVLVLRKVKR